VRRRFYAKSNRWFNLARVVRCGDQPQGLALAHGLPYASPP
jgi:hypothetical protein